MKNNAIMCINDGIIFPTPATAAKYYFLTEAQISRVLAGKQRTAGQRAFALIPESVTEPDELASFRRDSLAAALAVGQISRFGLDVFRWTPEGLTVIQEGGAVE